MSIWPVDIEIREQGGAMWLIELLDEALPDLTGGQRDELAAKIVSAIPPAAIAAAVAIVASAELKPYFDDRAVIALAIGEKSAESVVKLLGGQ